MKLVCAHETCTVVVIKTDHQFMMRNFILWKINNKIYESSIEFEFVVWLKCRDLNLPSDVVEAVCLQEWKLASMRMCIVLVYIYICINKYVPVSFSLSTLQVVIIIVKLFLL